MEITHNKETDLVNIEGVTIDEFELIQDVIAVAKETNYYQSEDRRIDRRAMVSMYVLFDNARSRILTTPAG